MYKYDFGLSFAGEDRAQAEKLAQLLKDENVRVFYDLDEQSDLWGKDLYQKFQLIYGKECRFFIPFVSTNYVNKLWPKHELKQAQARDFKSDDEYILPLRLDDTELPGLNETTGYIDLRHITIENVATLCLEKLVKDSSLRQFYIFLRENNPDSLKSISRKEHSLSIRVSTSKANELENILNKIDPLICSGANHYNTLLNSCNGKDRHIASSDPEPHTTFSIQLTDNFYGSINA